MRVFVFRCRRDAAFEEVHNTSEVLPHLQSKYQSTAETRDENRSARRERGDFAEAFDSELRARPWNSSAEL